VWTVALPREEGIDRGEPLFGVTGGAGSSSTVGGRRIRPSVRSCQPSAKRRDVAGSPVKPRPLTGPSLLPGALWSTACDSEQAEFAEPGSVP